jgi:ribonuclease-3
MPDWSALEERLGLTFKNAAFLREALVHASYLNENPGLGIDSNERLEFLGDAALGLVVAQQLYKDYPAEDEGQLTELRTHLVRRETLARAAQRLGLGDCLLLGRGEEAAGGRRRPTNLARAYEALVGALFLDGGLPRVRRFVKNTLNAELEGLRQRPVLADAKSRLQELVQSRWQTTPSYRLVRAEGPDHARRFRIEVVVDGSVLGVGEGRSKQQAEKAAARQALERLETADDSLSTKAGSASLQ